jgi:hypothetical protein
MDADDISLKSRLEKQFNFMEKNIEFVAVGGNAIVIDINGSHIYVSDLPLNDKEIKKRLPETPFYHSAVMFRKLTFLEAGSIVMN